MRDSAGIAVVEGDAPNRWQVADTPVWVIGSIEGSADDVFHQVVAAQPLRDGSLLVADQGSKTLRIFRAGGLRATLGRPGSGPFEFRMIDLVAAIGDSILVYDAADSRISVWTVAGQAIREMRMANGIRVETIDTDGGYLGTTQVSMSEYGASGNIENHASVVRLGRTGQVEDSLVVLPFSERLVRTDGRSTAAFALPFGRFGLLVPAHDGFCYTYGYVLEVRCFGGDGRLLSITRLSRAAQVISTEQKSEFAEWFSGFVDDSSRRAAIRKRYTTEWTYPQHSPAAASFLKDRLGCMWIEEYRRPRLGSDDWYAKEAQGTGRWIVLDRRGEPVARLTAPTHFSPTFIDRDLMVGVWRDELGVQTVRALRLERTSNAGANCG